MKEIDVQNNKADEYYEIREVNAFSQLYSDYWFGRMFQMLEDKPRTVLDVCCGTGILYKYITDHDLDMEYTGIELSGRIIRRAKAIYPDIRIVEGDICETPLEDKFDLIVIRGGLHHLKDPGAALTKCHEALSNNGSLLVSEPIDNPVFHLLRKMVYTSKDFSEDHVPFLRKELLQLFEEFEVRKVEYLGVFAFPFAFPDIIKLYAPETAKRMLIRVDRVITSCLPFGWHMMVHAKKQST